MLPEERACYIDLLIYQHQHGIIPNEPKRLMMYCSGCNEDTVKRVLNQKFNQMDDGWLNHKLNHLVNERSNHRPKKIAASVLAGLISKSKLDKKKILKIKKNFKIGNFIEDKEGCKLPDNQIKTEIKKWFNQMVNHLVNNLENENEDENINKDKKEKGVKGERKINYPWDSEDFKINWDKWILYKKNQHKFNFKTEKTEQTAIDYLKEISKDEKDAIKIINTSIANGWKGLFQSKVNNQNNGRIHAGSEDFKF